MDRRGFLKGILGAGAAVAAKGVAPSGLIELKCKNCQGPLMAVGDVLECEYCHAKYALGGVVMQEEEDSEPEKKMFDVHRFQEKISLFGTSSSDPYWGQTSALVIENCRITGFRDLDIRVNY